MKTVRHGMAIENVVLRISCNLISNIEVNYKTLSDPRIYNSKFHNLIERHDIPC